MGVFTKKFVDGKLDRAYKKFGRKKMLSVSFHETEFSACCYINIRDLAKQKAIALGFDELEEIIHQRHQLDNVRIQFLRENDIDDAPIVVSDEEKEEEEDKEEEEEAAREVEDEIAKHCRVVKLTKTEKKDAILPLKKRVTFSEEKEEEEEAGPSQQKKKKK